MTKPKSRKRRKLVVFGLIVLVLGGLAAAALLRKKEPVTSVQTEKVTRRDLVETVVANGRIQPVQQVKISAEVSGEIIELPVKEGQEVRKGDLLVKIKPDVYAANVKSAEAGYQSALASLANSNASLRRAELELQRNQELFENRLLSELDFMAIRTSHEIAKAQNEVAQHQVEVARASLDRTEEELTRTIITAPLAGTISQLNSELGERVVGTAMMTGTEIMTIADLDQMEARVDIGEIDIVLVQVGQSARLEVDAFRDREFQGTVTEIANSSKYAPGGQSQEAIKFEVRIRVDDKESFRPGMSVTAEVETRSRTNVLTVPIQSVTTRAPKPPRPDASGKGTNRTATAGSPGATNAPSAEAVAEPGATNLATTSTNSAAKAAKPGEPPKPIEVVFVVEGDQVRMAPVTRGISDNDHTEILSGLEEGQEVVSGGYRAISRDLEDGRKIMKGGPSLPEAPKR
ncbi:MAG: efflux RND transporter periplasmic adaptor subunit [Verrucomicrobiales bacterium]|nr:efflux RND transporter periplasmic adaptor subunit [Verrucomicrobiales bacterium]MCP5526535.1 efflux RND transporter periplasmic adaptor subunit [Verrucomicrobiales bacterium]